MPRFVKTISGDRILNQIQDQIQTQLSDIDKQITALSNTTSVRYTAPDRLTSFQYLCDNTSGRLNNSGITGNSYDLAVSSGAVNYRLNGHPHYSIGHSSGTTALFSVSTTQQQSWNALTISFWCAIVEPSSCIARVRFGNGDGYASQNVALNLESTHLEAVANGGSLISPGAFSRCIYNHYALTVDASLASNQLILYCNGSVLNRASLGKSWGSSTHLALELRHANICDLRVENVVRDEEYFRTVYRNFYLMDHT